MRPLGRPFESSRVLRVSVARGNIPYSAVTHPLPLLRMNEGTTSSMEAVQYDSCISYLDEDRSLGSTDEIGSDVDGSQSIGGAIVGTIEHARF